MGSEGAQVDYERLRAEKIAQNRAKLAQLGLVEASQALITTVRGPGVTLEAGTETQPRKKRRVVTEAEPLVLEPSRVSSRLRGQAAPSQQQAVAEARREAEEEENAGMGRTRKGTARKQLTLGATAYVAPFTLWSIGVTVWDLGHIHRGAWAHRYWSNSGCLFHHAYPVGYRASKVQFGRSYDMVIEEGPTGPVFKVIDQKTGVTFSGPSPTKPWTDVCLAHKTGQRISGPLFFGFSDIVTQRAIASLYTPEELQAALQGEKVEGAQQSAEERAAKDFCSLEGVGETTAMALAFTTQLGGAQHRSLASLRAWVQESEAHQQQLQEFLTSSEEMPEATRKWPAWRLRMVPKILAALCRSGSSDAGREGEAGAGAGSDSRVRRGRASSRAALAGAAAMVVPAAGGADVASLAGERASRGAERQQGERAGREPGGNAVEAALPARGAVAPAGNRGAARLTKENWHTNKGSAGMAAGAKAAAAAAAPAGPLRASSRQRRANSKYDQFLVDAND